MAILNYVPPKKKIIDHRSPEGGYYNAKCEVCGTEFYPKRSNAKYCSPNCSVVAHRILFASGGAVKKPKSPTITHKSKSSNTDKLIVGKAKVISFLGDNGCKTHGLRTLLTNAEIGDFINWEGYEIAKVSQVKYAIKEY